MKYQTIIVILLLCSGIFISNGSLAYTYFDVSSSKGDPKIILGPFTQHQEKNSIIIIWQTNNITVDNSVLWGETPDCLHTTHSNNRDVRKETNFHTTEIAQLRMLRMQQMISLQFILLRHRRLWAKYRTKNLQEAKKISGALCQL